MIANIKNAFKNTPDSDFPRLFAGELKISGFGSCMNGLWNIKKSDIDVTCIVNDKLDSNQRQLLNQCKYILRKVAMDRSMILIPSARVPIITFQEKSTGVEVDFNVNNILGLHNSNLIYTYC